MGSFNALSAERSIKDQYLIPITTGGIVLPKKGCPLLFKYPSVFKLTAQLKGMGGKISLLCLPVANSWRHVIPHGSHCASPIQDLICSWAGRTELDTLFNGGREEKKRWCKWYLPFQDFRKIYCLKMEHCFPKPLSDAEGQGKTGM